MVRDEVYPNFEVLVVDDDPAIRELIVAYFHSIGMTVSGAHDGRAAIAARVGELLRSAPMQHYDFEYRKQLFAMKSQPPKNQPRRRVRLLSRSECLSHALPLRKYHRQPIFSEKAWLTALIRSASIRSICFSARPCSCSKL